jgi:hypothetical protein
MATLLLASVAGAAPPPAGNGSSPHAKPSSFAPHHTAKRSFGAPIQTQILHKRQPKKSSHTEPTLHSTPLPDAPK